MAVGIKGHYKYREFSVNLCLCTNKGLMFRLSLNYIIFRTLIAFVVFAIKPTILTMISLEKKSNQTRNIKCT
jgi:hypothetical protein